MHMPLHLHMPLSIWGGCHSWKEGKRTKRKRESCFLFRPQGGLLRLTVFRKEREKEKDEREEGVREEIQKAEKEAEAWVRKKTCLLLCVCVLMWSSIVHGDHSVTQLDNRTGSSLACQSNKQAAGESEVLRGFWFIPVSWRLVHFHSQDWRAGSWQVMGFYIGRKQTNKKDISSCCNLHNNVVNLNRKYISY